MTNFCELSRWVEIDLDKLAANFAAVSAVVEKPIIAVVKNDAYGFGALAVARCFEDLGAAMLAVTTLDEALELRDGGISAPILVFEPPTSPKTAAYFAKYSLTASLDGKDTLAALESAALASGPIACHIKLNTGMNRFGVNLADLPDLLERLAGAPQISIKGLYSHLATALEPENSFAERQIADFAKGRELLFAAGFSDVTCHLANSAGALKFPEARYDAVRMGSVLYGQLGLAKSFGVKTLDPFCAKARVAAIRELKKGDTVGYGREFTAQGAMRVAVVPYGYGDGFGVMPSTRPLTLKSGVQGAAKSLGKVVLGKAERFVYLDGRPLRILGRVAMQNMLVDLSDTAAKVGDVVDVPIRRTAAARGLARLYVKDGEIADARCLSKTLCEKLVGNGKNL